MNILAIETSCDDTSVAILKVNSKKTPKFKILSGIVSSQVKIHKKWGGVFPSLAQREHQRNLPIVLKKALKKAGFLNPKTKFQNPKLDLIAVTIGPGLEPCLWVGVNFVKDLAKKLNVPIVPVNHIEAHILANFIGENTRYKIQDTRLFPAICLVVSGGHTQLILMKNIGEYEILGETRDDAAGECFDKVARILGLGYPGGPIVAKMATEIKNKKAHCSDTAKIKNVKLPRPMINQKNYDFSFSGLKTAVLYDFKNRSPEIRKSKEYIQEMCAETQQAIIDVLVYKTLKAAKNYRVKAIIIGGGVAANNELRRQFKQKIEKEISDTKHLIPNPKFCTDNAVMIALTAYFYRLKKDFKYGDIEANANLTLPIAS